MTQNITGDTELWYLMWATRGRLKRAMLFYEQNGIETYSPEYLKRIYSKRQELTVRKEKLFSNWIFAKLSPNKLKELKKEHEQDVNNLFLETVKDRTKSGDGVEAPPIVLSEAEFLNLKLTVEDHEVIIVNTRDFSGAYYKEDQIYVVVEGVYLNTKGFKVRYQKNNRIAIKVGDQIIMTSYIPESQLRPVEERK